nr:PREDICTED: transcription factor IBH1-like [Nicotiana sylvestris]
MTTTPRRYLRLSRRSIKTRFAYRFLRALKKLNKQKKPNSNRVKQYHKVKLAAYASMASAVGSKRAWSRALLLKIRNRGLTRALVKKRVDEENPGEETGFGYTNELRKLVPGGEVMDFYNLLDETADYIKCLSSQVQVMRNILDLFSS